MRIKTFIIIQPDKAEARRCVCERECYVCVFCVCVRVRACACVTRYLKENFYENSRGGGGGRFVQLDEFEHCCRRRNKIVCWTKDHACVKTPTFRDLK